MNHLNFSQREAIENADAHTCNAGLSSYTMLAYALQWALDQIEPSLDPDHQAAHAAASSTLLRAGLIQET
jgi:hypothetical protein